MSLENSLKPLYLFEWNDCQFPIEKVQFFQKLLFMRHEIGTLLKGVSCIEDLVGPGLCNVQSRFESSFGFAD